MPTLIQNRRSITVNNKTLFQRIISAPQYKRIDEEQIFSTKAPFDYYRLMRKHPTVRFLRRSSAAPLLNNTWSYEGEDEEKVEWIRDQINLHREFILRKCINGLFDFGWQAFELIFEYEDGTIPVLRRLKPLYHDFTKVLIDTTTGELVGLRNETGQQLRTDIPIEKCLYISDDADGEEVYGNESTLEILRETYDQWREVNRGARQYDNKIAGAHWIIKYPNGVTDVEDGTTGGEVNTEGVLQRDNYDIAKAILDDLESSGSIVMPQWFEEFEKAGWEIDLKESSGGQSQFIERFSYLDKMLARGAGFTERSVFEAEFGTKADAGVHMDLTILSMALRERDIACEVQTQVIDRMLDLRYGGHKDDDAVKLVVAPLVDTELLFLKELYKQILNSSFGPEELDMIDMDAVRDRVNVPKRSEEEIEAEQLEDFDFDDDVDVEDENSRQEFRRRLIESRSRSLSLKFNCGANAPGGGGFQRGNKCQRPGSGGGVKTKSKSKSSNNRDQILNAVERNAQYDEDLGISEDEYNRILETYLDDESDDSVDEILERAFNSVLGGDEKDEDESEDISPTGIRKVKATINDTYMNSDELDEWVSEHVSSDEDGTSVIASMSGALDDSEITPRFVLGDDREVFVSIRNERYIADRIVTRLKNGDLEISNENLTVHDTGKGLGTEIFSQQVESAKAIGNVKRIRTYAIKNDTANGYYTWPRLGYDGDIPEHLKGKLPKKLSKATRLSDLMKTKEGRNWWKDNGDSVRLEFDLSDDSTSMRIYRAYLKERAKRNG